MDCPGIAQTLRVLMPVAIVTLAALVAWLPFEVARTIRAYRERATQPSQPHMQRSAEPHV